MRVGSFIEPEPRILYLGDCSRTVPLGNFFFLVQGQGRQLLIDTGVTKSDGDAFNPSVVVGAGEDPFEQLASRGVDPESIEAVISTHAHWDHLSPTLLRMPRAKLYISPRELEMIERPPHPWFARFVYSGVIDQLTSQRRIVHTEDGDEIAPGIRILATPGHTFGGQSVAVETARGTAVVTGDVCFTYRNLEDDIPPGFNHDLVACYDSLARIREAADVVLPGHDPRMLEMYPDGVG